jgi:predicted solute-binding protein
MATPDVAAILRRSYAAGIHQFDTLVREESAASGLSEAVVEDYLRHALHFELDSGDLEGLNFFYRLAAEDGLVPSARPLAFV